MRQAGAVSVNCPGSLPWRLLQSLLVALSMLFGFAWLALTWGAPAAAAWGLAVSLSLGAGASVWRLWVPQPVTLGWDGAQWTIASADSVEPVSCSTVDVMLDFQDFLLLRGGAGRPWVAVHRSHAGPAFADLCTALYAQHGPGAQSR